jgi:hypothetical protein
MKLLQLLTLNDTEYELADDRTVLELSAIGKAQFTVNTSDTITKGMKVEYAAGYAQHGSVTQIFLGYVDSVTSINAKQSQIYCRELVGALAFNVLISLRHPDLQTVLAEVTEQTGLTFSIPDKDYCTKQIPNFVSHGSGLHILDSIGKAFEIDDYVYQQHGDGVIYVGSWQDSRWQGLDLDIPDHHFSEQVGGNSARMVISPALRPGVMLNGWRVKRCEYQGNFMTVGY